MRFIFFHQSQTTPYEAQYEAKYEAQYDPINADFSKKTCYITNSISSLRRKEAPRLDRRLRATLRNFAGQLISICANASRRKRNKL